MEIFFWLKGSQKKYRGKKYSKIGRCSVVWVCIRPIDVRTCPVNPAFAVESNIDSALQCLALGSSVVDNSETWLVRESTLTSVWLLWLAVAAEDGDDGCWPDEMDGDEESAKALANGKYRRQVCWNASTTDRPFSPNWPLFNASRMSVHV